jgi:hypothetical protein
VLLGVTTALAAWAWLSPAPPPLPPGAEAGKDVLLYEAVRARLALGEPYYPTLGEELVRHGFPTWPTFHWRTPLTLTLGAALPWPIGARVVFLGLVGVAAAATASARRDGVGVAAALGVALGLAPLGASAAGLLFSESWAGALLALSAAGFLADRPAWRVLGGAGALAFRELAAPWCALGLVAAVADRRWREAGAWLAVILGWLALYAAHAAQVAAHAPPDSVERGWFGWLGVGFALRCLRWFVPVTLLPALAPAVVATAAVTLVEEGRGAKVVAAGALGYLVLFGVAGLPFNDYWGCLLVGLWGMLVPLGGAAVVRSLRG